MRISDREGEFMSFENDKVVLMLPVVESETEPQFVPSSGMRSAVSALPISIEQLQDLVKDFTDYSIDQIEVHVKGIAQTDGLTRLVVGLSGEAGVKLVMKKKNNI